MVKHIFGRSSLRRLSSAGRNAVPRHASRLGLLMLTLFLILSFSLAVFAQEGTEKHVFDEAGLFGSDAAALEEQAGALASGYGQKVMVVTTNDTKGKSSRNFAADLYDSTYPNGDSGVIFLMDMQNRQIMLVTTGHAIDVIRDIDEESVYDAAIPGMKEGRYSVAASRALERLKQLFERGVAAGQYREKEKQPNRITLMEGLLSAGGALASGGSLYGGTKRRYRGTIKPIPYALLANRFMDMPDEDQLIDQQIAYLPLPRPERSSSSGSSGRSSTWTGSSGTTHGGGGGRGF